MTPEEWQRIKAELDAALSRPAAERGAWLEDRLGDQPELQAEVRSLLDAYAAGGSALEPPGAEGAAQDAACGSRSSGEAEPEASGRTLVGEVIGPYRLVREIGRGGMGVVYLAERDDGAFERAVALKLIQAGFDSGEIERRFVQERQILARLDHPYIARLLDGGTTADGWPYLVMEHVEGEPIDAYCAAHRLDLERFLELFLAICSAVDYAHRNLVVHRDLKPGNVLVTADGTPKLLDFGIAKLLRSEPGGDGDAGAAQTRAGLQVMTPEYASPEQMRGDAITTATDVYSLGVMLYELLTGERPYDLRGRSLPDIARLICEQEVRPPSTAARRGGGAELAHQENAAPGPLVMRAKVGRRVRGDLDAIVLKALRKEPEQRYASAEQLAADLRLLREGRPVRARQGSLGYRVSKFVLRHRVGVAAAAAFAVLLLAFALSMAVQVARTRRALEHAQEENAKAAAVQSFLEETLNAANPETNEGQELTVQEALDRARERIASSFPDQPLTKAAVQVLVGRLYSNLGRYEDAEPLLRQALETRSRLLRDPDSDLADVLETLGLLLGRSGRYDEAEALLRRALSMREQLDGHRSAGVAKDLDFLARTARGSGDVRHGAELERQALEVHRRVFGERDPGVVHLLAGLAELETGAGDLGAAEAALREAVDILDGLSEPPSAMRAELEEHLGQLLEARGRAAEAVPHYRAALDANRRVFGDDHHWVALTLVRLGVALGRQGSYDEGEAALREGVGILERTLGPDHPDTATALNNLAFVLGERGDLAEAAKVQGRVVEVQRRNIPDNPELGVSLRNLGWLEIRQHRYTQAREHIEEALAMHRRHYGEEHLRTLLSRLAWARVVGEQGDWARSVNTMQQVEGAFAATLAPDHPRLAEARSQLGLALTRLGRYDQAERQLLAALPVLRQAHGPHNFRVQRTLRTLIDLCQTRGDVEGAAGYREQLDPEIARVKRPASRPADGHGEP